MEIRTLKAFLVVAEEQNITRAASRLGITQPTLSRQLMQLEEELGVKLFKRCKHCVALTEEGLILKRRAQEMVSLAARASQELSHEGDSVSGTIAIGCAETGNMAVLSQWMCSFREKYPEVVFELTTANAGEVRERLEYGLLDFGMLIEPVDTARYHSIRMPFAEKWYALMRSDSPLAKKERIEPADLTGYPLIITKRQPVRGELESWLGRYAPMMDIVAFCSLSCSNRSIMVENRMGIALVQEFECTQDKLCLRPLFPELANGCVLVWKKDQTFSPAIRRFIAHMQECGVVNVGAAGRGVV